MEAEKQKAIELVDEFMYIDNFDKEGNVIQTIFNPKSLAKSYAIKCVEVMLEEYPSQAPKGIHELERHIYWQKVLTHIKEM